MCEKKQARCGTDTLVCAQRRSRAYPQRAAAQSTENRQLGSVCSRILPNGRARHENAPGPLLDYVKPGSWVQARVPVPAAAASQACVHDRSGLLSASERDAEAEPSAPVSEPGFCSASTSAGLPCRCRRYSASPPIPPDRWTSPTRGFSAWYTPASVTPPPSTDEHPVRTDRKIAQREWTRGSGPGPGAVIGPGQERYGLSGLGEGDGEAERFHAARPSLR